MLKNSVNGLWHVVHDHIQVNFILLFSLSVKRVSERDHVRVEEFTHDLQFPILVSLILVNFLDCDDFPGLRNWGLHNQKSQELQGNLPKRRLQKSHFQPLDLRYK